MLLHDGKIMFQIRHESWNEKNKLNKIKNCVSNLKRQINKNTKEQTLPAFQCYLLFNPTF